MFKIIYLNLKFRADSRKYSDDVAIVDQSEVSDLAQSTSSNGQDISHKSNFSLEESVSYNDFVQVARNLPQKYDINTEKVLYSSRQLIKYLQSENKSINLNSSVYKENLLIPEHAVNGEKLLMKELNPTFNLIT